MNLAQVSEVIDTAGARGKPFSKKKEHHVKHQKIVTTRCHASTIAGLGFVSLVVTIFCSIEGSTMNGKDATKVIIDRQRAPVYKIVDKAVVSNDIDVGSWSQASIQTLHKRVQSLREENIITRIYIGEIEEELSPKALPISSVKKNALIKQLHLQKLKLQKDEFSLEELLISLESLGALR